ncbi:hypothetical protein Tco_1546034 [Tanacetum coccineum]
MKEEVTNPSSPEIDDKSNLHLLNEKGASRKGAGVLPCSCSACCVLLFLPSCSCFALLWSYASFVLSVLCVVFYVSSGLICAFTCFLYLAPVTSFPAHCYDSRPSAIVMVIHSRGIFCKALVMSEMEASKEGRSLADFRYGCVGYSVYSDMKNNSGDAQETEKELPVCVGIEVLVDRKVTNANSAPTHAHNKVGKDNKTNAFSSFEDNHAVPQPRVSRPAQGQSASDDFFSRQVLVFTRNANVVASGVAKNVRKVGNQIKESVDDILYPYRRRPKKEKNIKNHQVPTFEDAEFLMCSHNV